MAAVTNPDLHQPYAAWQEVDVVFPATANTDLVIPHSLDPDQVDAVRYYPVRKDRVADVYHDTTVTRKVWHSNYILLRSNIASAKMTLFLYTPHGTRTLTF